MKYLINAVDAEQGLTGAQVAHRMATQHLKDAEEKARNANQRLLDELRKTVALRDGLRVLQLGHTAYLLNPLASAQGGVVTSVPLEQEDA
jgi:hypothetical protein